MKMQAGVSAFLAGLSALWMLSAAVCMAQDVPQQSPAARHADRARAYANRADENAQSDNERAATGYGNAQDGNKVRGADDPAVEQAQKTLGETLKSLEKTFDLGK